MKASCKLPEAGQKESPMSDQKLFDFLSFLRRKHGNEDFIGAKFQFLPRSVILTLKKLFPESA